MKVTYHAAKRFLERVIGTDNDDSLSIEYAMRILTDNSCHLDVNSNCVLPIIGFKGSYIRVKNNTVVTVITKGKIK